ncbi:MULTISPECIES: 1-acyl-sn-glycerol-3-phosphate acyltransferase [Chryseobacterium]|uniref:1-acyl-sn-glycerol-3-phosphate acyltransferase n=1 Tax=Chryseobacterium camelliae TaxID=1265445 RepID=A0ABU0THH0_9FLAO|nr:MULTISPECIES: 1-acyl-sn-glycerol-3-phosphate acyltransferase [Chryseobacterium]MDT3405686.1 1-acyl-sn-glycerol-3-phosphate acyltransferase [Pseudacidovorax intermedius]MDQ1096506.1 1-acyl-sn-glycerol-3-phosphate acyltransferase [Chryseobacterium camelliae]MDQ1100447.1 1-acyl-sn-glycerol-3-phosphate acyltransferase [Chryseobacterium sp. SORGH_AS_1048]MDR6087787.1 1-acyl-sn-glycerol-3-phosphate acyltransferase [Chryseobacterium sp. SORGH_AS_0909]MDR6132163.1 1-acyl-sn-glycerol-3-phosphate acy
MSKFDEIRPYHDHEVNAALNGVARHPMMKALMQFTFPDEEEGFWLSQFKGIHSISEFQHRFISQTVRQIIRQSSEGLSTSGFDQLDKNTAYLFISNHRDIVLDTSLLNLVLLDHGLIMTSSAIGDNLVQKTFLHVLAKLNRNFLVQRGLSVREQLESSKLMSEYIDHLLHSENRSVWIAQREGRTKDGNDATQQGVLKMLAMAACEQPLTQFFKKLKIVPLSISYEYDPTDALKMPQIMAQFKNEVYIKSSGEDFKTMLSGILGQKKRIHLHAGKVLDSELDQLECTSEGKNKQLQAIAKLIDHSIIQHYRLWPTNYIAFDLLNNSGQYSGHYTEEEKQLFERRLEMRINSSDTELKKSFLAMYANPVVNANKESRMSMP